jgi:hypothetical protein
VFFIPGIWTALKNILNCNVRTTQEMVFPASLEHLTLFIAYCFQKKLASSTVLTYMSAINFLLQLGGYED